MLTLKEAWEFLETNFDILNVYDAYALGTDFFTEIDKIESYYDIISKLEEIEESFSIIYLRDRLAYLEEKLELFSTYPFHYKYTFPKELTAECTVKLNDIKQEIEDIEEKLDNLLNSIEIDDEVLGLKKLA